MFAPGFGVPGLTPEQIDAVADPAGVLPTCPRCGTRSRPARLIGPPEQITEQLMEIQHKYPGLEVVNVGQPVGTPKAVILEQLERSRCRPRRSSNARSLVARRGRWRATSDHAGSSTPCRASSFTA